MFLARRLNPRTLSPRTLFAPTRSIPSNGNAVRYYAGPGDIAASTRSSGLGPVTTHLLAGLVGGGLVVGYAYYHLSGIKNAIDTAKQAKQYLIQTRESVIQRHPNEAVEYLRKAAKSYATLVPGSNLVIDRIFNSIDAIVEEHQEEASEILLQAQVKIQEIIKRKELGNVELSAEIMEVLGVHLTALGLLGAKAGGQLVDPLLQRLPKVRVDVPQAGEKLRVLVEKVKLRGSVKPKDEVKETSVTDETA
uniref:Uncharacterized protein n=1 Tax=Moniliophthora roreri TaxID=221103 RepID=A0A0W0FE72_MONRR